MAVWGGLTNGCEKKGGEKQRENERYKQSSECRVPENSKKRQEINAKKQREKTEWERLEISLRKLEIPRGYFMQRWAQ